MFHRRAACKSIKTLSHLSKVHWAVRKVQMSIRQKALLSNIRTAKQNKISPYNNDKLGQIESVKMTFCRTLINVYFISAGLWKLISSSVLACESGGIWSVMCWWYENGYFEIAFPLFFNCSCSFGWQNILDWQTLFIIALYLVVY